MLTELLNTIIRQASAGYHNILLDSLYYFNRAIAFEIFLFGIAVAYGKGRITYELLKKLFLISLYFYFINHMHEISKAFMTTFSGVGLKAFGQNIDVDIFDPSSVMDLGYQATFYVWNPKKVSIGLLYSLLLNGLAGLLILFSFFVISMQLFISIIEFYVITVMSVFMLPFGLVFKAFSVEKIINILFQLSIKLMLVSAMITLSYGTLVDLRLSDNPTFHECFKMLVASGALAYLVYYLPKAALGYFSGPDGLQAGSLIGHGINSLRGGYSGAKGAYRDIKGGISGGLAAGKATAGFVSENVSRIKKAAGKIQGSVKNIRGQQS